jgi:hypothetical protein
MEHEDDVLTMPNLDPILSVVDETMTVDLPGSKIAPKEPEPDHRLAELELQISRLQCEELRGVILTGVVLNMKSAHLRKRVIECVHKHLLNKHRVLEYLVAQRILPLSAVKEDLRLLQVDKQFVLDQIDSVLNSVPQRTAK